MIAQWRRHNRLGAVLVMKDPACGWEKWIEYRPKLKVFDAFCAPADTYPIAMRMLRARKLRTDDLFAAIGFLVRNGEPNPNLFPGET